MKIGDAPPESCAKSLIRKIRQRHHVIHVLVVEV